MMDEDAIKQKLVTQASLAVINILEPSPSLSKYTNGPRSHQRLYNIVSVVNPLHANSVQVLSAIQKRPERR